jgi:plasmid stabilization system protein ParE
MRDVARLRGWLAERSPRAAAGAVEAISSALLMIEDFPEAGPQVEGPLRELVVRFGRDGFIMRYVVYPEQTVVTRIHHGRERR